MLCCARKRITSLQPDDIWLDVYPRKIVQFVIGRSPGSSKKGLGKEIDNEDSVYYWAYKVCVHAMLAVCTSTLSICAHVFMCVCAWVVYWWFV